LLTKCYESPEEAGLQAAFLTDLLEREKDDIKCNDGVLDVNIGANQLISIKLVI